MNDPRLSGGGEETTKGILNIKIPCRENVFSYERSLNLSQGQNDLDSQDHITKASILVTDADKN